MDRQPAVRKFDLRNSVGAESVGKALFILGARLKKKLRGSPISPRSTRETFLSAGSRQESSHRTNRSPRRGRKRCNELMPVGLSEASDDCDNLPNDLSIAISEWLSPMNSTGIRVNDQAAVLPAAASADIGSITFENHVQRLLP